MGNVFFSGGKVGMIAPVGGTPLSALMEGTIVNINEGGTLVPFYLAKHDYESGLNGAGRVLMVRKYGHTSMEWGTNQNTYADNIIDTWCNSTYKSILPSSVQEAIGETEFYYTPGYDNFTLSTLKRSVFILSLVELSTAISGLNINIEGTLLPIASTLQACYPSASATYPMPQYTRTIEKAQNGYAFVINNTSFAPTKTQLTDSWYVRPCFTLPSTVCVDEEPNADGSVNLL